MFDNCDINKKSYNAGSVNVSTKTLIKKRYEWWNLEESESNDEGDIDVGVEEFENDDGTGHQEEGHLQNEMDFGVEQDGLDSGQFFAAASPNIYHKAVFVVDLSQLGVA